MPRRTTVLTVLTALATAPLLAVAPDARADLVTHCTGTGGAVTVPNDLLVAAGESCSLAGTTVTGNVRVADGADLVVAGGTVHGEVQVAADGYLDASGTTIDGAVTVAPGGYGTYLRDSRSGRVTVQPRGSAPVESFLFLEDTTVEGAVTVSAGEVRLDRTTQVTGDLSTNGAYYTDVHDSFVDGALSVLNNSTGSVVCGSAVQGRATFAGNRGGVQLGPNGVLDSCASGGYWARDVTVSSTTGDATVDDNVINGRLQVTDNSPAARVAPNNRVRGGVTGQQAPAATSSRAAAAADEPRGDAEQRSRTRRSAAVEAAAAAGPADL